MSRKKNSIRRSINATRNNPSSQFYPTFLKQFVVLDWIIP